MASTMMKGEHPMKTGNLSLAGLITALLFRRQPWPIRTRTRGAAAARTVMGPRATRAPGARVHRTPTARDPRTPTSTAAAPSTPRTAAPRTPILMVVRPPERLATARSTLIPTDKQATPPRIIRRAPMGTDTTTHGLLRIPSADHRELLRLRLLQLQQRLEQCGRSCGRSPRRCGGRRQRGLGEHGSCYIKCL